MPIWRGRWVMCSVRWCCSFLGAPITVRPQPAGGDCRRVRSRRRPAIANPVPVPSGRTAAPLPPLECQRRAVTRLRWRSCGPKRSMSCSSPRCWCATSSSRSTICRASTSRSSCGRPSRRRANSWSAATTSTPPSILPTTSATRPTCRRCRRSTRSGSRPSICTFYPLFQQAYQALGYPNGYFNDRLVVTIDNLLAAPDVTADVALVRPNVMYQYADPKLEIALGGPEAHGAASGRTTTPSSRPSCTSCARDRRCAAQPRAQRDRQPAAGYGHGRAVEQIRGRVLIGQHTCVRDPSRRRC